MLQGLNLPFTEFAPPESGLNYSVTLPEQGVALDSSFADIFKLEPALAPLLPAVQGVPLPASGNSLPQGPDSLPLADTMLEFESELPQADVVATNPLPTASLPAAIAPLAKAPLQETSSARQAPVPVASQAPVPVATGATPAPSNTIPTAMLTPTTPPVVDEPIVNERGNIFAPGNIAPLRPLPSAPPAVPQNVANMPLPPATSEAVSNLREQVTANKKSPTNFSELRLAIEPAGSPKPLPEKTPDNQLQPAKPVATMPATAQLAPAVASGNSEPLMGQQVQIVPLQTAAPANRIGAEFSATPPQAPASIATPVTEPAWGDRIGDRLLLMASNKMQTAEIRLTPAELGPLRVRISMDDGTANVNFHAQHAVTRDALEQAMPRLRELFAENGLTLQQGDLSESDGNGVQQGKQEQENRQAMGGAAADGDVLADNAPAEAAVRPRSDQLVDTFA